MFHRLDVHFCLPPQINHANMGWIIAYDKSTVRVPGIGMHSVRTLHHFIYFLLLDNRLNVLLNQLVI